MSTHKHIDTICLVAVILSLLLCAAFMNGEALGIQSSAKVLGYEARLFDTAQVHTIDIVIDDWNSFLATAQSEEYSVCSVVIDGEAISNVGIRGKGNTSLSTVSSMDSDRYSFKIEFDQYDSTKTYHGLDKLSLNNIIQDSTYMKDYLTYQMMGEFGVPAPLCSYAYLTVNGEDWGLYLAVEAVEDAFLQRNYGSSYGELYKPDSMDMGGGRGNGRDFEMPESLDSQESSGTTDANKGAFGKTPAGWGNKGDRMQPGAAADAGTDGTMSDRNRDDMPMSDGGRGGIGSAETKLQYIDEDSDSYSAIFGNAKTDVTEEDQRRLISSLRQLSEYENLTEVVNVEAVLRYFVVHNYVVNGDSYTGSMIHNYYLYEENGRLSMIPWDYNLAFGTFRGGDAASAVNDDIDAVLSDRPMQAWIFSDETYAQRYYALYAELLEQVDIQRIINHACVLIAPYVEKDPTKFCTYTEFQTAAEVLKEFCALRSESVRLQLSGSTETVEVGTLDLTDMGTMNMGGGRGDFGGKDAGNRGSFNPNAAPNGDPVSDQGGGLPPDMQMPEGMQPPGGMQPPAGIPFSDDSKMAEITQPDSAVRAFPSGGMLGFDPENDINGAANITASADTGTRTQIAFAASVLLLALGLVVACKFKRK